MYQEIKEISDIISDNIEFDDIGGGSTSIDEDKVAKAIHDAGYHKTVWHKVADGDLPAQLKDVLCVTEDIYKDKMITVGCITNNNLWFLECDRERWHNIEDVIAWTELPEYKE